MSTHEQLVSDQIRNGLTRYESWVDAGHECLVPIDLDVTVGRLRYRDRIMWDANEPPNKAGAEEFANGVCTDLGLGYCLHRCLRLRAVLTRVRSARRPDFAAAIVASLTEQQDAKRQAALSEAGKGKGGDKPLSEEDQTLLGPRLEWVDAPAADEMEH